MSDEKYEARRFRFMYEYAAKKRVWQLKKLVREVVHKVDPIQLLELGCPGDEYDYEINEAASNIDRERGVAGVMSLNADEIAHIFALIFHRSFGQWTKPVQVHTSDHKMASMLLELESRGSTEDTKLPN